MNQKITGTFDCVHHENISCSQMAKAAIAATNSLSAVRFQKDKEDIADNIFISDNALYRKIGYYPKTTFAAGIKKLMDYRKATV